MSDDTNSTGQFVGDILAGNAGSAQGSEGITTRAFLLNLAIGFALFTFQTTGFFLLKSSSIGRRIYQPKTYLVQERLRVEAVPVSPFKWLYRIFTIRDEDLKAKCGLDGYFFIRFIRAMIFIFLPLMVVLVTVLLPVNYNGGKNDNVFFVNGKNTTYNIRGLDTLSWQNVAPTQTNRYWAHLICALLAISWALWRVYREKRHFIKVRQDYLTSPEHRLRASARTILVTNIPSEYRTNEALENLYDVFVDNDDRSKLRVWVNRDYSVLRKKVLRVRSLRHALEKEELKYLRNVNKQHGKARSASDTDQLRLPTATSDGANDAAQYDAHAEQNISTAFAADHLESEQRRQKFPTTPKEGTLNLVKSGSWWKPAPKFRSASEAKTVTRAVWLRAEIAHTTMEVEEMLRDLDNESRFKRQNSAFIQFDRQMSANMACGLVSHDKPGCMNPRFLDVAPHEIVWKNMGLTSKDRVWRALLALALFVAMIILWGIPASFLGLLSQLNQVRQHTSYLQWLQNWPDWIISLISGPVVAILLALLIQLLVPALCRKLAVLVGCPTRSTREIVTQRFYFTFLFIELVLVTSISSGLIATISTIINNPVTISNTLATDLPKAANYFFNYLIIQALGFSGSVLFQYLRLLYITTIWPWFTQTPREEAWLQTTIPHQMWGNVYPIFTNFAAIGLIYSVTAPLMLVFASAIFCLFWVAYRHNYYYVQRNKVDTHGKLFNGALSQVTSGIYVLEITLIGLFFLVRDDNDNVACTPQAIIMIVALVLTASIHYIMEAALAPLYELIPVTLEDKAVVLEKRRFGSGNRESEDSDVPVDDSVRPSIEQPMSVSDAEKRELTTHEDTITQPGDSNAERPVPEAQRPPPQSASISKGAANARKIFGRLNNTVAARLATAPSHASHQDGKSRKMELADELGSSLAGYPDELARLTPRERDAELSTAYQDPVTREPPPIIWIPQDAAGVSEEKIGEVKKYGRYLQYSNSGAYLTKDNKCEITQPAPDSRADWLLDWSL